MKKFSNSYLLSAALLAVLWAAPSFAEDMPGKMPPDGESTRAMNDVGINPKAKPMPGIKVDRSASRGVELSDADASKAFTLVGRSRDGKETRQEPGDEVIKALKGEAAAGDKRTMLDTVEPEAAADEQSRAVVGGDNRIAVKNSQAYPYTTIGYLEMTDAAGVVWSCSAAAIGRNTVVTAGHCLYNHADEGGWRDKFTFFPAINGENVIPYGGYEYETAYVFEGFITNYKDSYDQVWPYDIGLLTFKDPIGDTLGYLGYSNFADAGDFQGNLVGYQNDKTAFTMWRSTCNILAEDTFDESFDHDCDFEAGANGAPIYVYDQASKSRNVVGINIGVAGEKNWALRLYAPVYEWIRTVNK